MNVITDKYKEYLLCVNLARYELLKVLRYNKCCFDMMYFLVVYKTSVKTNMMKLKENVK